MLATVKLWGFALELGLCLLLVYVLVLWALGWVLRFLASARLSPGSALCTYRIRI